MLTQLRPALVMLLLLTVLTGLAYPLADHRHRPGASFPYQANGSLIVQDGKVVGSTLIGQNFTDATLLPRRPVGRPAPTATTPTRPSGGSNLGPHQRRR